MNNDENSLKERRRATLEKIIPKIHRVPIQIIAQQLEFNNSNELIEYIFSLPNNFPIKIDGNDLVVNSENQSNHSISKMIDELLNSFEKNTIFSEKVIEQKSQYSKITNETLDQIPDEELTKIEYENARQKAEKYELERMQFEKELKDKKKDKLMTEIKELYNEKQIIMMNIKIKQFLTLDNVSEEEKKVIEMLINELDKSFPLIKSTFTKEFIDNSKFKPLEKKTSELKENIIEPIMTKDFNNLTVYDEEFLLKSEMTILNELQLILHVEIPLIDNIAKYRTYKIGFLVSNRSIIGLNIVNCKMDVINSLICDLKQLKMLNLAFNEIQTIPSSINNLKNLIYLNLGNNKIQSISESLGELNDLKQLYLQSNSFSTLPFSIGKLKNLEILDLSSNRIEELPSFLGNLLNLKQLYLAGNNFSILPGSFNNLQNLIELYLQDNKLDIFPNFIETLEKLEILFIAGNRIKNIPKEIENLQNLKVLFLQKEYLSEIEQERIKNILPKTDVYFG